MAWSPAILLAVMMIGYPIVQIAALRFRRPYRIRYRALIMTLCERYTTASERAALAKLMSESRGHWPDPVIYLLSPIAAIVDIAKGNRLNSQEQTEKLLAYIRALLQSEFKIPSDAEIWSDSDVDRAILLMCKLRIAVSPISFLVGGILTVPAVVLARIRYSEPDDTRSLLQDIISRFVIADRTILN